MIFHFDFLCKLSFKEKIPRVKIKSHCFCFKILQYSRRVVALKAVNKVFGYENTRHLELGRSYFDEVFSVLRVAGHY